MIYRLAGAVGVDPGPLTARKLLDMAEGVARLHWTHTAELLAAIANANRGPDTRPFYPEDFNPFQKKLARRRRRERQAGIAMELKDSLPRITCKAQKG